MKKEFDKNRNRSYDFVAGVLIIYMIFCHIMQWSKLVDTNVYMVLQRFLYFFMPWFFYKSGIYAHHNVDLKNYFSKNFKLLILPVMYFSLFGLPFVWITLYLNGDENITHYTLSLVKQFLQGSIPGNLPLWFLITLFEVKLSYVILRKVIPCEVILALAIIGVSLLTHFDLHRPISLFAAFTAMIFYCIGHLLAQKESDFRCFVPCIILYVFSVIFYPQMVDLRTNTLIYGNYYVWILMSIAACVTFNKLAAFICGGANIICLIGENSMMLYVIHWIIIEYVSLTINFCGIYNHSMTYSITLFSCVIILLPIMSYILNAAKLRFLFGR